MQIACDTHVHCYQFDQIGELLNASVTNFKHWVPAATHRVLFFTDGNTDKTWQNLRQLLQADAVNGDWFFTLNEQSGFIEAQRGDELLYLAPARQINSAERLEFLLLGCTDDLPDGIPAAEIIAQHTADTVIISPWGVGKWLGQRGKIMSALIADNADKPNNEWFLGDNGGRPSLWRGIKQCREARQQQQPIFNGSDPLPIAGEIHRVAAYGIHAEVSTMADFSLPNLLESIKQQSTSWRNFGRALGIVEFIKGRIAMARR